MKAKIILPTAMLLLLASCGGEPSPTPGISTEPSTSSSAASSVAPTFNAMTLSEIHDARVAETLSTLDGKYVDIKGKVTFAKRVDETYHALTIQSGKHAIEVSYPEPFTVNVGDAVEVKGRLKTDKIGTIDTIYVLTYTDVVPGASITVIDESISVETVTISKESDLVEFQNSQASIAFTVTSNDHKLAAFDGRLSEGQEEFIVANKLGIAEKFEEHPYAVGDTCKYTGVFGYSPNTDAKVIRYFDREGFTKLN